MTKNVMKVVAILLAAVMVMALAVTVFAEGTTTDKLDPSQFDKVTYSETGAETSISRIIASIISLVQIIGTGVAIIMLIVLAIKYISAAPGDKADIKKHAVVYVVGAVVLFAATGILGIVKKFAANVNSDES